MEINRGKSNHGLEITIFPDGTIIDYTRYGFCDRLKVAISIMLKIKLVYPNSKLQNEQTNASTTKTDKRV